MNPPPTSGSIPLQEYRRDVPPGWTPGDKLKLWYRICNVEDELVGPLIAGRLYGRASKVATTLRVPRPDGSYDVGDAALVRLSVDEVLDPVSGAVLQHHIPSGVQHLVAALRQAFGQQDQDLATASLERFFSLSRQGNKLSLAEYSVEFDTRYDEAHDRAGLNLNDVGKFFLWFKHSGLPSKMIDDIKLQVNGDYTRFNDARALALRISPNRHESENEIFYGHDDYYYGDGQDPDYYYQEELYDYGDDYDWWYGYGGEEEEDGEWIYEEGDEWDWYGYEAEEQQWTEPGLSTSAEEKQGEEGKNEIAGDYYKGKGKGGNDGCFNCGSKWHMARDCPMGEKGSGKSKGFKGKGKSKGKGFYRWRPRFKGKGKGKSKFGKGKSKGKGFGKRHWFSRTGGLEIDEGIPDTSTMTRTSATTRHVHFSNDKMERQFAHTSSEEEDFLWRRGQQQMTSSSTTTAEEYKETKLDKQHAKAFTFAVFHSKDLPHEQYFAVKGEKRHGLLIDPGAASGLVGSDTLKQLLDHCVRPCGRQDEVKFDYDRSTPVSGISGSSDATLGQVTIPLTACGHPITYTADVLGGEGSLCPALVGNPALRAMDASIFTNWFENGDGILLVGTKDKDMKHYRMFRILLTDSGHYMLPTDYDSCAKVASQVKREVVLFCSKVAQQSMEQWNDVHPRVAHCFLSRVGRQTGADRCESQCESRTACESTREDTCETKDESKCDKPDSPPKLEETTTTPLAEEEVPDLPREEQQDHSPQQGVSRKPAILAVSASDKDLKEIHHDKRNDDTCNGPCGCWMSTPYEHDDIPEDDYKLKKRYKAIPEEYYTTTGLHPVTPHNFKDWFAQAKGRGLQWHAWEICSGSGRLSLILLMAGLVVGFPVDYRYGWDINNYDHQQMLWQAQKEFQPGYMHFAPDCAPWSVAGTSKDPVERLKERKRDWPGLSFIQDACQEQSRLGHGYGVEQPLGSAMWQPLPENPLRLEILEDYKNKQRVDQCMHGSVDESKLPVQKATALGSNVKWTRTALRCSGHGGVQHAHLQGQGPGGVARTASAAVYPKLMCQRMKLDIINFLYQRKLMKVKKWPSDMTYHTVGHYYDCVRCQLGRACPRDIPHTLVPRECRYGRWAPGTGPRAKSTMPPDPLAEWKRKADAEVLDTIELNDMTSTPLSVQHRHWLNKLLLETIHSVLGIFSEAASSEHGYQHWIENAVQLSLFKEIFRGHFLVRGVRIALRAWHKSGAQPHLQFRSGFYRLIINGDVKDWKINPTEDMREMSHSQINEAMDEDNWTVTLFGHDFAEAGGVPAPSTPVARTRAIPAERPLPPRQDDVLAEPELRERKDDDKDIVDAPYEQEEEFETGSREDIKPIRPNYNLKLVLRRLPKLYADEDITKCKQLLLGLHERLWHSPAQDFANLLRRAGMPSEIINLAQEAVQSCAVCRKYVRLPNRPQTRANGAVIFNDKIQMDLFNWESTWFMLIVDEATRFKMCGTISGQESEDLLRAMLDLWIYMFGPPGRVVMDQQVSLMGHEAGGEFERLNIERCPRGTTAGHGAEQHTGTGIVERHVQLLKMTMYKLRAELQRQGLDPSMEELAQESAMAHNITLNYKGVTPSMAVFGTLPRGFYEVESDAILNSTGALQTDITVFERAIRIRRTALAQAQQAVVEDRVARASRTRPHQLDLSTLTAGTSEVEFYREVKNDPGWRGPALLLRLDADEGVAVIQYQGKPYLVSLRFIRPYRGIYMVEVQKPETDETISKMMRYVEAMSDYKVYIYGWIRNRQDKWVKLPKENDEANRFLQKAILVSKAMTKRELNGCLFGKALRSFKPPSNTTGILLTWISGGRSYAVQEHKSDRHLQMKHLHIVLLLLQRDLHGGGSKCSGSSTSRTTRFLNEVRHDFIGQPNGFCDGIQEERRSCNQDSSFSTWKETAENGVLEERRGVHEELVHIYCYEECGATWLCTWLAHWIWPDDSYYKELPDETLWYGETEPRLPVLLGLQDRPWSGGLFAYG